MLHIDGEEDFVLGVVRDELIGERAAVNHDKESNMQPLRVDENTMTGLLCEYC